MISTYRTSADMTASRLRYSICHLLCAFDNAALFFLLRVPCLLLCKNCSPKLRNTNLSGRSGLLVIKRCLQRGFTQFNPRPHFLQVGNEGLYLLFQTRNGCCLFLVFAVLLEELIEQYGVHRVNIS